MDLSITSLGSRAQCAPPPLFCKCPKFSRFLIMRSPLSQALWWWLPERLAIRSTINSTPGFFTREFVTQTNVYPNNRPRINEGSLFETYENLLCFLVCMKVKSQETIYCWNCRSRWRFNWVSEILWFVWSARNVGITK